MPQPTYVTWEKMIQPKSHPSSFKLFGGVARTTHAFAPAVLQAGLALLELLPSVVEQLSGKTTSLIDNEYAVSCSAQFWSK